MFYVIWLADIADGRSQCSVWLVEVYFGDIWLVDKLLLHVAYEMHKPADML